MNIQGIRAEVLNSTTHKYSSSEVSGGGGYVATTGNGAVYGTIESVKTVVRHHVNEDIWLRDLKSGQEFKIEISDSNFSVRPGHILRLTYDEGTAAFERIFNENTQQTTNINGIFNETTIWKLRKESSGAWVLALFYCIPFLNAIFLLVTPYMVSHFPTRIGNYSIQSSGREFFIKILLFGVFAFSSLGLYVFNNPEAWVKGTISIAGLLVCFRGFVVLWRTQFDLAASLVTERAKQHDAVLLGLA